MPLQFRVHGNAHDPLAQQLRCAPDARVKRQGLWNRVPMRTAFACVDAGGQRGVQPTLARQQGNRQDFACLFQHMNGNVWRIQHLAQVGGPGLVMRCDQQAKKLAQKRLILGKRIPVQTAVSNVIPKPFPNQEGSEIHIQQQRMMDEMFEGIVFSPADRLLQTDWLPTRRLHVQLLLETQCKPTPTPFITMQSRGEHTARVMPQHLEQQGNGNGGGFIHHQHVSLRQGLQQVVRRKENWRVGSVPENGFNRGAGRCRQHHPFPLCKQSAGGHA